MEFTKSLIKGKLIKRYKRFFTDVKMGKEIVTAHCPNTGSMKGLLDEGNEVYLLPNNDPKRKLKYGLEIIKSRKNLVGVNTHMANRIVEHGLKNNLINELKSLKKKKIKKMMKENFYELKRKIGDTNSSKKLANIIYKEIL